MAAALHTCSHSDLQVCKRAVLFIVTMEVANGYVPLPSTVARAALLKVHGLCRAYNPVVAPKSVLEQHPASHCRLAAHMPSHIVGLGQWRSCAGPQTVAW